MTQKEIPTRLWYLVKLWLVAMLLCVAMNPCALAQSTNNYADQKQPTIMRRGSQHLGDSRQNNDSIQQDGAGFAPANSYAADPRYSQQNSTTANSNFSNSTDSGSQPVVSAGHWQTSSTRLPSADAPNAGFVGNQNVEVPSDVVGNQDDLEQNDSLAIPPPSDSIRDEIEQPKGTLGMLFAMITALMIVVALFFVFAYVMKKSSGTASANLPKEVIQVLGRIPFGPRQQMVLMRVGRKLIVVSQQMGATQTICEIEDPLEVDRLCGLVEQNSENSVSQSFKEVFQQLASKTPAKSLKQKVA